MELRYLVCILFLLLCIIFVTLPLPRFTQSTIKAKKIITKRSSSNLSRILFGRHRVSCREILICGIAIYDESHVITNTRKSHWCNCDEGYKCVLTYNLLDRHAYIFQCREESMTENMYLFPP